MAYKPGNGEKKLRKVDGINDGRVWLNVLEAPDGSQLFTVNRSFRTDQGWKSTPFFHRAAGDLESIRRVLDQYEQRKSNGSSAEEEIVM